MQSSYILRRKRVLVNTQISLQQPYFCQDQTLRLLQVPSLGWKDPLEEGSGNPLQYSRLENPMDRGAWQAVVHRVAKESDMMEAA